MSNDDFKKQEYWDQRYIDESCYEWFKGYPYFKQCLVSRLKPSDEVLNLGCGNSPFSYHMYEDGFKLITNIDYSPICIQRMAEKYKSCSKMKWIEMNILKLKFKNSSFDVVIEKGTLDALLVDEKSPWCISDNGFELIQSVLDEVSRVLKPGGRFISITFAQPHFRKQLLCRSRFNWNCEVHSVSSDDSFEYFVYVMTRDVPMSDDDKEYELSIVEKRKAVNRSDDVLTVPFLSDDFNDNFLLNIAL